MQEVFVKIKERLEEKSHWETASDGDGYFEDVGEVVYLDDAIEIVDQVAKEFAGDTNVGHKNGWIPCSEKLPEDGDHRFYMCIVENHEEDLPMFCQFVEELGFGYWQDIFDKDSLGFVDSEFSTNEELGYEKVIAWQPLPGPYEEKEND